MTVERHWDSLSGRLCRIWATSEAVAPTWANGFSGVWHWELLHFPVKKVPWLWEREGNTQPRFVQREKQVVGERERRRVCIRAEELLPGAGRRVSEVVMDPGWQESFNKCRSVGPCVFLQHLPRLELEATQCRTQLSVKTSIFLVTPQQLLAAWLVLDELLPCWQPPWRGKGWHCRDDWTSFSDAAGDPSLLWRAALHWHHD